MTKNENYIQLNLNQIGNNWLEVKQSSIKLIEKMGAGREKNN